MKKTDSEKRLKRINNKINKLLNELNAILVLMGKKNLNPKNIEEISGVNLKNEHESIEDLYEKLSCVTYTLEDYDMLEEKIDDKLNSLKRAKKEIKRAKRKKRT